MSKYHQNELKSQYYEIPDIWPDMVFSFSYMFDKSFESYRSSPTYEHANIGWFLEVESENDNICIVLYGAPNSSILRPCLHWEIVADVTCKIADGETFQLKNVLLFNNQTDEQLIGKCLYKANKKTIPKEPLEIYGGIPFTVRIYNIRVEGVRKFGMKDYSNSFNESDMTISIKNNILHTHSQLLRLGSTVFENMIERTYKLTFVDKTITFFFPFVTLSIRPSHITLNDEIPVDEFLELLHHIYFPTEIVDDDNLRMLLHWAKEFEVTPVLAKCEKLMRDTLCNPCSQYGMDMIIEYLLLSWRYNIEPLEALFVYTVFGNEELDFIDLNTLMGNQHYQEMNNAWKLKLLEFILESKDIVAQERNKRIEKKG